MNKIQGLLPNNYLNISYHHHSKRNMLIISWWRTSRGNYLTDFLSRRFYQLGWVLMGHQFNRTKKQFHGKVLKIISKVVSQNRTHTTNIFFLCLKKLVQSSNPFTSLPTNNKIPFRILFTFTVAPNTFSNIIYKIFAW